MKQLFLYLTAEYKTPENELNQVVLWDKIILRGENPVLDMRNMHTKYYFWDDGNGLRCVGMGEEWYSVINVCFISLGATKT